MERLTKLALLVALCASCAAKAQVTSTGNVTQAGRVTSGSAAVSEILFEDDFESDEADLVPTWAVSSAILNTNPSFSHGGTDSGEFRYTIAAGGDASQDSNKWVSWVSASPQSHFFIRGYVYFKTPEVGLDTFTVQRKLIWWSDSTVAGTSQVDYAGILTSWTGSAGTPTPNALYLSFAHNAIGGCAGSLPTIWDMTTLTWDTWYSLEVEVQLNTPGSSDGVLRLWKDGSQVYSNTALNLRGTCADTSFFSVGRQVNRTNSEAIDEYRYWDDVKIATGYIGP